LINTRKKERERPTTWEAWAEGALSTFWRGGKPMENRPFNDTSYRQYLKELKIRGSRCKKWGALNPAGAGTVPI